MRIINIIFAVCFCCCLSMHAQTATSQDCLGALQLCSTGITPDQHVPVGEGMIADLIANNNCFLTNPADPNVENNSIWYTFTTASSGQLEFDIVPDTSYDDLDFMLFNLTGDSCESILQGTLTPIRCNFSGTTGSTGLRTGYTGTSAGPGDPSFLLPVQVQANETYVLFIDNYYSSMAEFSMDFSNSTTTFVANTNPTLNMPDTLGCQPSSLLEVPFTDFIDPATVLNDGSQFTISGPDTVRVTGIYAATSTRVTLLLNKPFNKRGQYTLTVLAGSGSASIEKLCGGGSVMVQTDQFFVPEVATGTISFSATGNAGGNEYQFSFVPSFGSAAPQSYSWYFGDGTSSTDASPTHAYGSSSQHQVTLVATSADGCQNTITNTIFALGIGSSPELSSISVFPNPTPGGMFALTGSITGQSELQLNIYTVNGQKIHSATQSVIGDFNIPVDLKTARPGVYILQINTGSFSQSIKLVIE